jgi:hypothetical protein
VFGSGKPAMFTSMVGCQTPEIHIINKREILFFPNVNSSNNNGMISEAKFLRIVKWAKECLNGNIIELPVE